MIEIRFHGRGGQGAVTAAEILAKQHLKTENTVKHSHFSVLSEKGAPVMAFTRIHDKPIRRRYQVYNQIMFLY